MVNDSADSTTIKKLTSQCHEMLNFLNRKTKSGQKSTNWYRRENVVERSNLQQSLDSILNRLEGASKSSELKLIKKELTEIRKRYQTHRNFVKNRRKGTRIGRKPAKADWSSLGGRSDISNYWNRFPKKRN